MDTTALELRFWTIGLIVSARRHLIGVPFLSEFFGVILFLSNWLKMADIRIRPKQHWVSVFVLFNDIQQMAAQKILADSSSILLVSAAVSNRFSALTIGLTVAA